MRRIASPATLAVLLLVSPAWAGTTYYVDKSCTTAGNGTDDDCAAGANAPYGAIKDAVEYSGLAAGDTIEIAGDQTYTESGIATQVDGSGFMPITVTRYRNTGKPVWKAAANEVTISVDHDYWTFKNIDFDGGGKTAEAIMTIDGKDVEVETCDFHHVDGHGISIHETGDGATIYGCTFHHVYGNENEETNGAHHGITTGRGTDPDDYTLTDLSIDTNSFDEIAGDGIQIFEKSGECRTATVTGTIIDNLFERGSETNYGDYGENGIDVKATGLSADNLIIKGNKFRCFRQSCGSG